MSGPLGRGIGLGINDLPYLGEEFADLKLEPGMVVVIESCIQIPGTGGAKVGDVVLLSESGLRRLTLTTNDFKSMSQ